MIGTKSGIIVPGNGHMESASRRGSAAFDRWLRVPRVDLLRGRGEDSTYEVDKLPRGAVVALPLLRNQRLRRTRHASSASHAPLSLVRPSAIARIVERDILAAGFLPTLPIATTYSNSMFTVQCRHGLGDLRGACAEPTRQVGLTEFPLLLQQIHDALGQRRVRPPTSAIDDPKTQIIGQFYGDRIGRSAVPGLKLQRDGRSARLARGTLNVHVMMLGPFRRATGLGSTVVAVRNQTLRPVMSDHDRDTLFDERVFKAP